MKVNCHIDPNIEEEHLDLFVREMNPQISNLLKSFTSTEPVLWCYDADQIIPIKFSDIFELDSVSKDNFGEFESTEWSIVFNQSNGEVRYYHRENYQQGYVFYIN